MKFFSKIRTATAVAAISMLMVVGQQATAMDDPDTVVKERQVVMDTIKNTVGALSKAVKSGASTQDILAAADAFLTASASTVTIEAFATNTHGKSTVKTTATEKVWTDWDRFEQALVDMESGAKEIQLAAAGGTLTSEDQLGVALKECGFCHRSAGYRAR